MMRHQKPKAQKLWQVPFASAAVFAVSAFTFLAPRVSYATPVYLKLESRFPSGHYPRPWLETRTKKVQFQRWLRVETKDKAYGWIPEDHLLTALKLVNEALVTEDVPGRTEPSMEALDRVMLLKGTRLQILENRGSWVKARIYEGPIVTDLGHETWVPTESIKADLAKKPARVFISSRTNVYVLPGAQARVQEIAEPGRLLEIVGDKPGWFEVRTKRSKGFVRREDVTTAEQLGTSSVRVLADLTSLRSSPLPYADLIRTLAPSTSLKVIEAQTLRWGSAKVKDVGEVWWPISDQAAPEDLLAKKEATKGERLMTVDLFRRKIFDMTSSPAIPALKFVSAQGIFRTLDGHEWTRIPQFEDKNYPIAASPSGTVFVGPFLSEDQGDTFQQWIRWDTLVATLRHRSLLAPRKLQIMEIRPQDSEGRSILLKLNLGWNSPVAVVTDDQGHSWRLAHASLGNR